MRDSAQRSVIILMAVAMAWTFAAPASGSIVGSEDPPVVMAQRYGEQSGYDMVGARVSSDGSVLDPEPFPITASDGAEIRPSLSPSTPGRMAAVYSGYREEGYGTDRAFLRFVDEPA